MTMTTPVLLSLLLLLSLGQKCPFYDCDKSLATENKCSVMRVESGIAKYKLNGCNATSQCNLLYNGNPDLCAAEPTMKVRYNGEWCLNSDSCMNGTCVGNKALNDTRCVGRQYNQTCEDDIDCDAGLFCNNANPRVCNYTANLTQNCSDDLPCNAYTVCNKTCILKGSVENGKAAVYAAVCKSQHIRNGVCADGPKLKRDTEKNKDPSEGPIICPKDNVCQYAYGTEQATKAQCVCGRNAQNLMVCATGAGDVDMTPYADYVKSEQNTTRPCHIAKGPVCIKKDYGNMTLEFLKAYVAYNKFWRWALYYNNSECVKKVINFEYSKIADILKDKEDEGGKFGLYLFLGIAIGAVVVIAILLLVIYFKRKKGDDADEEGGKTTKLSPEGDTK